MDTILRTILLPLAALTLGLGATHAWAQRQCDTCLTDYQACAATCDPLTRSGANCLAACERTLDRCLARADCGGGGGACPVIQSVYDIDVPAILLRGEFTVNGADPLPYDAHRGRIELRNDTLGVVDLGSVHYGTYQAWIVPGVYDVVYLHEEGDILPQNAETILMHDVALVVGGVWNIDIPSVLVMGDILVDGAPAPASVYENGHILFRDTETGASFPVGMSLDGSYMAMVIPGTYDVLWSRMLGGSQVPLNGAAVVAEDLVVAGLTEFDVDVPVVELTGTFKFNGAAPTTSVYENGEVLLRDNDTGDLVTLGQTRDRTWSALIVPGTYDVVYRNLLGGSVAPANTFALVEENLDLTADGSVEIDIPVVTLQGDFTLDGAPFPASVYENAHLWLNGSEPDDLIDLGSSLDGGYQLRVVPGTYDVYYQDLLANGLVPENDWALVEAGAKVPKGKGGIKTHDIAVTSGLIDVEVTVWGAPPPASIYENGTIDLLGPEGGPIEIGQTRDGGGSARVVEGTYDVRYGHLLGDTMPLNGDAKVGEATSLPLLIPTGVDLQPGLLAGVFSQNGVAFPALGDHGRFVLRDVVTGDRVGIGDSTAGLYDETLNTGTYDVIYDHVQGVGVAANVGANLGCITFEPLPPGPVLTGGR